MPFSATHAMPRRTLILVLAGMTTLATVQGASAEDGIGGFFSSIFGGGSSHQQASAPAAAPASYEPSPTYGRSYTRFSHSFHQRTLTVRLHKAAPKVGLAQVPTKPEKVSIFEDRTLKRGDAVMTADGIRVFAGSAAWPYTKADFVDLAAAKDLSKDTVKVLAEVDRLPHG
jgi:hypothetical protein